MSVINYSLRTVVYEAIADNKTEVAQAEASIAPKFKDRVTA